MCLILKYKQRSRAQIRLERPVIRRKTKSEPRVARDGLGPRALCASLAGVCSTRTLRTRRRLYHPRRTDDLPIESSRLVRDGSSEKGVTAFGPSGEPVKHELFSALFETMEYAPHSALRLYGCGRSEVMAAPNRARLQSSSLRPHTLLSRTPREVRERLDDISHLDLKGRPIHSSSSMMPYTTCFTDTRRDDRVHRGPRQDNNTCGASRDVAHWQNYQTDVHGGEGGYEGSSEGQRSVGT